MSRENIEKVLMENITDIKNKEIWIFGAGNTASLYYNGLLRLEKEGFYIEGYIDNDSNKWNQSFNGKKIVSLCSLQHKRDKVCVLICSIQKNVVSAIKKQLFDEGFSFFFNIDEVIFKQHKEKILQVYDLLSDEESKRIYEFLIQERMACSGQILPVDWQDPYFALPPFLIENPKEVFIDCGAYVGDTIERYIWKRNGVFNKIIGFEPDIKNLEAMKHRLKRLRSEWGLRDSSIEIFNKGVADKNVQGNVIRYEANNGLGSKIEATGQGINNFIISLDDFLHEPYSFLKADIESWEYKMLIGASKGIKEYMPLLAICIYHNAVDFYEIPLLIHSLVPEYKLAVRHHSYTLADTVLYAWLPNN